MSENKISFIKYLPRHPELIHAPYIPEMDFYTAIRLGDIKKVRKLCKDEAFHEKEGLGILSDDKLRNMKYHFVISTALVARQCIEGGLSLSEAYSMSDYYINSADKASSIMKISELHDEMAIAYATRMRKLPKEYIYSRPVSEAIEYILEHLDTRITISDLCEQTGLSASYLSRIFKKETGMTVTDYVLDKKLETAKNMLDYSNLTITQIAHTLAFPSQSYFTKVFRERFGVTPGRYRRQGSIRNSQNQLRED